ncbi:hypothetical protein TrLO_g5322 [Triparma laevis f. longispina]|uniref:Uncharacterized protein n=1 Tax=Triparma laevis f. longispina TaxID=1714387 RepID=A0A9W7KY57_9STRA|nr:hypothetical protein TrLO_g5322 [Triparma laevis f. longispina]
MSSPPRSPTTPLPSTLSPSQTTPAPPTPSSPTCEPWTSTWTLPNYQSALSSSLRQQIRDAKSIKKYKNLLQLVSSKTEEELESLYNQFSRKMKSEREGMVEKVNEMEVEEEGVVNRLLRRVGELEARVKELEGEE